MIDSITAFFGGFFVIGTLWFVITSVIIFGIMVFLTETEKDIFAGIFLIIAISIIASVNDYSIITNPVFWLKWSGIYLALGLLWSYLKWVSYSYQVRSKLRKYKRNFLEANKSVKLRDNGTFGDADFRDFATYLNDVGYYRYVGRHDLIISKTDVDPTMEAIVSDMVSWAVWWPFSAFWTFLNDPVRRIVKFIVRRLRLLYESTAALIFKNEV